MDALFVPSSATASLNSFDDDDEWEALCMPYNHIFAKPSQGLFRLSFCSVSVDYIMDEPFKDGIFNFNRANGLTGTLFHVNGLFFEVLEGNMKVIEGLFHRIAKDSRHTELLVIKIERNAHRQYSAFSIRNLELGSVMSNCLFAILRTIPRSLKIMQRYLQPAVVQQVQQGYADPPEIEELVVMFVGLHNTNANSSWLSPHIYDNFIFLLSEFYEHLTNNVLEAGGEVVKFIQASALVCFPASVLDNALGCANNLAAMVQTMCDRSLIPNVKVGIGLRIGHVIKGNIGSEKINKSDYTLLGGIVNVASRLKDLTKHVPATIVVDRGLTNRATATHWHFTSIGSHPLKGVKGMVPLFTCFPAYTGMPTLRNQRLVLPKVIGKAPFVYSLDINRTESANILEDRLARVTQQVDRVLDSCVFDVYSSTVTLSGPSTARALRRVEEDIFSDDAVDIFSDDSDDESSVHSTERSARSACPRTPGRRGSGHRAACTIARSRRASWPARTKTLNQWLSSWKRSGGCVSVHGSGSTYDSSGCLGHDLEASEARFTSSQGPVLLNPRRQRSASTTTKSRSVQFASSQHWMNTAEASLEAVPLDISSLPSPRPGWRSRSRSCGDDEEERRREDEQLQTRLIASLPMSPLRRPAQPVSERPQHVPLLDVGDSAAAVRLSRRRNPHSLPPLSPLPRVPGVNGRQKSVRRKSGRSSGDEEASLSEASPPPREDPLTWEPERHLKAEAVEEPRREARRELLMEEPPEDEELSNDGAWPYKSKERTSAHHFIMSHDSSTTVFTSSDDDDDDSTSDDFSLLSSLMTRAPVRHPVIPKLNMNQQKTGLSVRPPSPRVFNLSFNDTNMDHHLKQAPMALPLHLKGPRVFGGHSMPDVRKPKTQRGRRARLAAKSSADAASPASIRCISYVSLAHTIDEEEVARIAAQARATNESKGITGYLSLAGDVFMQVLEGEQHVVEELFDRLLQDGRHSHVTRIGTTNSVTRTYSTFEFAMWSPITGDALEYEMVHSVLDSMLSFYKTLERYTQPKVNRLLNTGTNPLAYYSHLTNSCVLVTDICSFTMISERVTLHQVTELVNVFLDIVITVVNDYGGEVNKLVGDCVIAHFPSSQTKRCLDVALAIQERCAKTRKEAPLDSILSLLYCGVGVSVGMCFVGNVGVSRLDFALIGQPVDECNHLESLTRTQQSNVLLAPAVLGHVRGADDLRIIPSNIHDVFALDSPLTRWDPESIARITNTVLNALEDEICPDSPKAAPKRRMSLGSSVDNLEDFPFATPRHSSSSDPFKMAQPLSLDRNAPPRNAKDKRLQHHKAMSRSCSISSGSTFDDFGKNLDDSLDHRDDLDCSGVSTLGELSFSARAKPPTAMLTARSEPRWCSFSQKPLRRWRSLGEVKKLNESFDEEGRALVRRTLARAASAGTVGNVAAGGEL